ncbi:antitoxin VbhA family protein [Alcaligenes faecalis]|uniref:Antitoxin VbhA family protein n=1 Tax=Alcaligenes faecalis TaxID=511 RepID=A0AAE9KPC1_ALCFA|nr:antitoxin VbhA family protein [Alcaligenes faecalis]UPL21005.1 antitoxin VbhA family protein [Alcaligenes faecalis]
MKKIELQAASEAARASVELEGFTVPKNALAESEKYIEGEISFKELIGYLYGQALSKSREKI